MAVFISNMFAQCKMNKGMVYPDGVEQDSHFLCSEYILVNTFQDYLCCGTENRKQIMIKEPHRHRQQ